MLLTQSNRKDCPKVETPVVPHHARPQLPAGLIIKVVAGTFAGLFVMKRFRKFRLKRQPSPTRAQVRASAGAAASQREQQSRLQRGGRVPLHAEPSEAGGSQNGRNACSQQQSRPVNNPSPSSQSSLQHQLQPHSLKPPPAAAGPELQPSQQCPLPHAPPDRSPAAAKNADPPSALGGPSALGPPSDLDPPNAIENEARCPDPTELAAAAAVRAARRSSRPRQGLAPSNHQEHSTSSSRRDEYDPFNPSGYQPETDTKDWRLFTWETAQVLDPGLQPHLARAQLDTGNAGRTLINKRFAKRIGLADFDGRPLQAHTITERTRGVVAGASAVYPVINIQYTIKGEAPQHAWLKTAGLVIGAIFARRAWKQLRKSRRRRKEKPLSRSQVQASAGAAAERREQQYRLQQTACAPRHAAPSKADATQNAHGASSHNPPRPPHNPASSGQQSAQQQPNTPRSQPTAPRPQPTTPRPEPTTPRPQPSAPTSQPSAPRPQANAPRPQPNAPRPQPVAPRPQPTPTTVNCNPQQHPLAHEQADRSPAAAPPPDSLSELNPPSGSGPQQEVDPPNSAEEEARRPDRAALAAAAARAAGRARRPRQRIAPPDNRQQGSATDHQESSSSSFTHDEYDLWNPPGYQPQTDTKDWRLFTWETAQVMDPGLQPHPARANLDTGNDSMTLINLRFAKRLGLVDFDGRPTQASSRVTKVRGVVAGASADYSVINIQYTIKGKRINCKAGLAEQDCNVKWDLLISRRQIAEFELDGFKFTAR